MGRHGPELRQVLRTLGLMHSSGLSPNGQKFLLETHFHSSQTINWNFLCAIVSQPGLRMKIFVVKE